MTWVKVVLRKKETHFGWTQAFTLSRNTNFPDASTSVCVWVYVLIDWLRKIFCVLIYLASLKCSETKEAKIAVL